MPRVIVYIDGFNVYFGLKESGWTRYYWLDYPALAERLAHQLREENTQLVGTKYFTSRISSPEAKRKRQTVYLEALESRGNIEIYYGNYRESHYECSGCHRPNYVPNEKQTDVNIATQMLIDGFQNNFDTAILIGGDSDLVPPLDVVRRQLNKRVVCVFPPRRISKELQKVCNGFLHLGEVDLKHNQLPDQITKADGYVLERPAFWK
jgi:uncharacterized LabA/DUF88 family protein